MDSDQEAFCFGLRLVGSEDDAKKKLDVAPFQQCCKKYREASNAKQKNGFFYGRFGAQGDFGPVFALEVVEGEGFSPASKLFISTPYYLRNARPGKI